MAMADNHRLSLAAELIRQSPPGQVNDVMADIQVIIEQDPEFTTYAAEQLKLYNQEQFSIVILPGETEPTIISSAAIAQTGGTVISYVDLRAKQSFEYDHRTGKVSNQETYLIPEDDERFRAALEKSLSAYVANHYPGGVGSVFCSSRPLRTPEAAPAAKELQESAKDEQPATDADEKSGVKEPNEEDDSAEIIPQPEPVEEANAEPMTMEQPLAEPAVDQTNEIKEEAEEQDKETVNQETTKDSEDPIKEIAVGETTAATEETLPEQAAIAEEAPREPVSPPVFTIQIVGNKYNVQNFWTGRWRTEYIIDLQQPQVKGSIKVDVHYFEAGNVRLAANHTTSFGLPEDATSAASQIITTISKIEADYQQQLNATYAELGDKAFRSLRRALPITRQKVDWEKIGHWKAARNTASQ